MGVRVVYIPGSSNRGIRVTLVNGELQQVMRQAGQAVPDELMKFDSTIKKKEHKLWLVV